MSKTIEEMAEALAEYKDLRPDHATYALPPRIVPMCYESRLVCWKEATPTEIRAKYKELICKN